MEIPKIETREDVYNALCLCLIETEKILKIFDDLMVKLETMNVESIKGESK